MGQAAFSACKDWRTQHHKTKDDTDSDGESNMTDIWEHGPANLWAESDVATLSIFTGTWNMGNVVPEDNLGDWLPLGHDLYVIGVQECQYSLPSGFDTCVDHLISLVQDVLGSCSLVCKRSMWMNHVICMASDLVKEDMHLIETSIEETGVGHVLANKGGLAMSMWIGDTGLCFVSSHLAAHQGEVKRRNMDFSEIIDGIRLGKKDKPITNQFHHVIWLGDLNYRINLEKSQCEELIARNDWEALYTNDQLNQARQQKKAFYLFNEGTLTFPPTFKHIEGEGPDPETGKRAYDAKSNRVPAWCDRILWRSFPDRDLLLQPGSYTSCPSVCSSDHSPVGAVFRMDVPKPGQVNPEHEPSDLCVEIRNVKGLDMLPMDSFGKSDPYLVFTAHWSDDKENSSVKEQTLTPDWNGETFRLQPKNGLNDADWLESRYVLVSVFDEDQLKEDDHMGYGVISLKGCQEAPKNFTVNLTYQGLPAGTLTGTVALLTDVVFSVSAVSAETSDDGSSSCSS